MKCLCEKMRWSIHTRAIALTLSPISSRSGISYVPMIPHDTNSCKSSSPLQPKSTTSAPSWGLDEPANTWHWINRHSKCALALNQHKVDENSSRSNEQHTFTDNFSIYVKVYLIFISMPVRVNFREGGCVIYLRSVLICTAPYWIYWIPR